MIQPTTYSPRRAGLVADAPALVADQPAALVERDAVQRAAAVADRAQHEPALDHLLLTGGHRPHAPVVVLVELVDRDAHAGHRAVLALAEDLERRAQEAQL
ncbi:MAG: hypothetical protein M3P44_12930, partial [Actinomycetota bacterium]|nr:hypothetical protein [Actinomycetota bacterium]